MEVNWQGVIPAVTTQFTDDESLDVPATLVHVDRLLAEGFPALAVLGSFGESATLDPAEKCEVLQAIVDRVAKRVPVICGIAEASTRAACRFASEAQEAGVDGLMVLPAMVYHASGRETVAHFEAVVQACDLPIMVYNNPELYHVDITPPLFDRLSKRPRIVAIKEASDDIRRVTDLVNRFGDRFRIFAGIDDLVLESALLGCTGWVSALANVFPKEALRLWELAAAGNVAEALPLYRWFTPLLHLASTSKRVQCIKYAAAETGHGHDVSRAPRLPLEGEELTEVQAVIRTAIRNRPKLG